jgi:D-xylose reductase
MIAGRYCRGAGINTLHACSSATAAFKLLAPSSFLSSTRTCLSRAPTLNLRRNPIAERRSHFATMATNTPYVVLNDGNKMPQVGFGLWKVDNATCADTVYNAIKAGYRLFDGACGMLLSFLSNLIPP